MRGARWKSIAPAASHTRTQSRWFLQALEVDLVAEADRVLGAGVDAGVAARAQVEVDRVAALPFGLERAEPARQALEPAGVHGPAVRLRQRAARAVDQQVDIELVGEQRGGLFGGIGVADDQAAPAGAVRDVGHRLRRRQLRGGQQRGDLRRGALGIARPAAGLADVDEVDRPHVERCRAFGVLVEFGEQAALLRARHQQRPRRLSPVALAARWNAPASRRHSSVCSCSRPSGLAPLVCCSAVFSAAASSGIVWLQSQISVFIGFRGRGTDLRWPRPRRTSAPEPWVVGAGRLGRQRAASGSTQAKKRRLRHLAHRRQRQRIGLAVVVDVDVQAVHHVEVRVGEQLFQCRVLHVAVDTGRRRSG